MNLRTELAGLVLQAETERVWTVPVHEQQILPPIAVDVQDLDGADGAGIGNFLRLSERMVCGLGEEVNGVFGQQQQVRSTVAVQITGGKPVRVEQAVVQRPAFRRAPAVGALIELHDHFLRLAIIGHVRPAIAVQVGHHKTGNPLLRGDGINAKSRVRRQLIQLALDRSFRFGLIGFAGLVVEQIDFRTRIVDDNQVLQTVTVQIGGAQMADLVVDGKNLRAGEAKTIGAAVSASREDNGSEEP